MMANTSRNDPGRVIRASEVGAFAYCARAWWLGSVEGMRSANVRHVQAGRAAHEQHGRQVILGAVLSRLAFILLILAGLAGLGWVLSMLVG